MHSIFCGVLDSQLRTAQLGQCIHLATDRRAVETLCENCHGQTGGSDRHVTRMVLLASDAVSHNLEPELMYLIKIAPEHPA